MFNDVVGDLDVIVGQFQVSDPLFKGELRLTYENYRIYKSKPGLSGIDLTYDRGVMLTYGLKGGTDLVLEVAQRQRHRRQRWPTPAATSTPTSTRTSWGAYPRTSAPACASAPSAISARSKGATGLVNSMWMAGADATWTSPKLELNLQYVERRDKNPSFLLGAPEVATRGGFRRADLSAARRRQPLVRSGAVQLGRLRPGRVGLHGAPPCTAAGCCGAISAWWPKPPMPSSRTSGKYPRFGIGLVTAF